MVETAYASGSATTSEGSTDTSIPGVPALPSERIPITTIIPAARYYLASADSKWTAVPVPYGISVYDKRLPVSSPPSL